MRSIVPVMIVSVLLAGCDSHSKKESHVIKENGTEYGVKIKIPLVGDRGGGGTATLICPKFTGQPAGAHGRECYLDSYDLKEF